jgi:hypothetical protein
MDEVDFTVLAATSVFTDFMDKCPPAEACRDAFDRTVKATLKMVNASGGFGQQYRPATDSFDHGRMDWSSRAPDVQRHHQRSLDVTNTPPDAYTNSAPALSALQKSASHRPLDALNVKTDSDAFHTRNPAVSSRSNANRSSIGNSRLINPEVTTTINTPTIPSPTASPQQQQQQRQLASPSAQPLSSPVTEMGPAPPRGFLSPTPPPAHQKRQRQSQQQFSPGAISFSDLQGIDFLQNLTSASPKPASNNTTNSNPADGGGANRDAAAAPTMMDGVDFSGLADAQMDLGLNLNLGLDLGLGFGLGWEGSLQQQQHDEFLDDDGAGDGGNEGGGGGGGGGQPQNQQQQQQGQHQQLDLFDGFFFSGPSQMGGK